MQHRLCDTPATPYFCGLHSGLGRLVYPKDLPHYYGWGLRGINVLDHFDLWSCHIDADGGSRQSLDHDGKDGPHGVIGILATDTRGPDHWTNDPLGRNGTTYTDSKD